MARTIDVDVQHDEIQVGDYILGTGNASGEPREGWATHPGAWLPGPCALRDQDGLRSPIVQSTNLKRRVLHANPLYHLTNPKALAVGDRIRFAPLETAALPPCTVTEVTECMDPRYVSIRTETGGRGNSSDYQIFRAGSRRLGPDGQPMEAEWSMVGASDLALGDYVRAYGTAHQATAEGYFVRVRFDSERDIRKESGHTEPVTDHRRIYARRQDPRTWRPITSTEAQEGQYIRLIPEASGPVVEGLITRVNHDIITVDGRNWDTDYCHLFLSTEAPAPPVEGWTQVQMAQPEPEYHEIPFSGIQVGDRISATLTKSDGTDDVKTGDVVEVTPTRAILDVNGTRIPVSVARRFAVSNRTPDPEAPLSERYPTAHHLKAAIYDITLQQRRHGGWCSEANDFVRELDIADGVDSHYAYGRDREVNELIAKLQRETPGDRGVSEPSFTAAFQALNLPPAAPATKSMTVQVTVPVDMTAAQMRDYVNQFNNTVTVDSIEGD